MLVVAIISSLHIHITLVHVLQPRRKRTRSLESMHVTNAPASPMQYRYDHMIFCTDVCLFSDLKSGSFCNLTVVLMLFLYVPLLAQGTAAVS
jgi:hypothetical protein